ncbi:hypothetical protein OUZ56_010019 [Daphnia magna]|uniref:Uncharacterized protein n=1 Tax=Daphnia magna TaxID=35525 RepID=A0ABR0AHM4_9CRUS|nr:hypothetical protein OUZ56_010019 [Daphnia magna]
MIKSQLYRQRKPGFMGHNVVKNQNFHFVHPYLRKATRDQAERLKQVSSELVPVQAKYIYGYAIGLMLPADEALHLPVPTRDDLLERDKVTQEREPNNHGSIVMSATVSDGVLLVASQTVELSTCDLLPQPTTLAFQILLKILLFLLLLIEEDVQYWTAKERY